MKENSREIVKSLGASRSVPCGVMGLLVLKRVKSLPRVVTPDSFRNELNRYHVWYQVYSF